MPDFTQPLFWVDLSLSLLVIASVIVIGVFTLKRKLPLIILGVGSGLIILAKFLNLGLLANIATVGVFAALVIFLTVNIATIRPMITNPTVVAKPNKTRKGEVQKVYDRYELCAKITTTVLQLSRTKTGALITFEKKDVLDNLVNTTGTILNAPVVPELLLSIFYEGTRLHDGAVIIRRDKIYSAAAFFPSTEKPLAGKFGSRHRAALGISEISDSVTVVVSEETGRISFAVDGELIHATSDSFERMLQDYLIKDE